MLIQSKLEQCQSYLKSQAFKEDSVNLFEIITSNYSSNSSLKTLLHYLWKLPQNVYGISHK